VTEHIITDNKLDTDKSDYDCGIRTIKYGVYKIKVRIIDL